MSLSLVFVSDNKDPILKGKPTMKVSCAVLVLIMFKLNGHFGHPIKGVEYGFSTHGRFWQKPLEGSESGGYLTSKYRTYIE